LHSSDDRLYLERELQIQLCPQVRHRHCISRIEGGRKMSIIKLNI
jgi:hypothetical protein